MNDVRTPLLWWNQLVDPLCALHTHAHCASSSRWSSSRKPPVRSPDLIGDDLVSKLLENARRVKNDKSIAGWAKTLLERIGDYETEQRLLVKLADTGRIMQLLEGGVDTSLQILNINSADTKHEWRQALRMERERRMDFYETSLINMTMEMAGIDEQLEVLTLMKHGVEKYSSAFTSRELDVISDAFDKLVRQAGVVIGEIPPWFMTSYPDNSVKSLVSKRALRSDKSVKSQEEICLRQVAVWTTLHHPHVRRFYGARHVGSSFVLHEEDCPGPPTWAFFRDCALGLQYAHRRGFACSNLAGATFGYIKAEKRGVLSGMGMEQVKTKEDMETNTKLGSAHCAVNAYSEPNHPQFLADVSSFGRVVFVSLAHCRGQYSLESIERVPSGKPTFLTVDEWNLIQALWKGALNSGMDDIVLRMKELDEEQHELNKQGAELYECKPKCAQAEAPLKPLEQLVDIATFFVGIANSSIPELLAETDKLCNPDPQEYPMLDVADLSKQFRPVHNRVADLYKQFVACSRPSPLELMDMYGLLLSNLRKALESVTNIFDSAPSMDNSSTISSWISDFQQEIDSLISKSSGLQNFITGEPR